MKRERKPKRVVRTVTRKLDEDGEVSFHANYSWIEVQFRVGSDWAIAGRVRADAEDFEERLPELVATAEDRAGQLRAWT